MAISDYLNKLVQLKNDLITTLRNKDVEVSDDEKLNTLVPKVDTIKTNPSIQLPPEFVKLDSNYNIVGLTIPEGVTTLKGGQFKECKKLTSVTLPVGIEIIPVACFCDCTSLANIIIPDGVTAIYDTSFQNCTTLKSVTIPESTKSILAYAFRNCTNLKNVYYKGTEEQWNTINIDKYNNGNSWLINATKHYNYVPE